MNAEIESLLALSQHGANFAEHAASQLICHHIRLRNGMSWNTCYWMLRSAMARRDLDCCRMYLRDWAEPKSKPTALISRFYPGEHYHVLGKKFDNEHDARQHLEREGYRYGGFRRVDVTTGD